MAMAVVSIISAFGILIVAFLLVRHVLSAGAAIILGILAVSLLLGFYFWVLGGGGALSGLVDTVLASLRETLAALFGFLSWIFG